MQKYTINSGQTTFLSDFALDFLRRRTFETGGLILLVAAVLLASLLVSYTPGDPSLNAVTDAKPGNLFPDPLQN